MEVYDCIASDNEKFILLFHDVILATCLNDNILDATEAIIYGEARHEISNGKVRTIYSYHGNNYSSTDGFGVTKDDFMEYAGTFFEITGFKIIFVGRVKMVLGFPLNVKISPGHVIDLAPLIKNNISESLETIKRQLRKILLLDDLREHQLQYKTFYHGLVIA